MAARIPATVITGFLGAGKTTLVRHLLENAAGRRIAVIVNEFGELGVDGELLRGCAGCPADGDVVELANGCICCTVADEFLPAMEGMLERTPAPDHIVIETSGLALPQPLIRAFNWPAIRTRVTVDAVVTLADAAALAGGTVAADTDAVAAQRRADPLLDHDTPLGELFEDQLASADLLLLNKADLVPAAGLAALTGELESRLRAGARVLPARFCQVPLSALFGLGAAAESDLASRHERHHHHPDNPHPDNPHPDNPHPDTGAADAAAHGHDEFDSFSVSVASVADPEMLAGRIREAMRRFEVYRIKGVGRVADRPLRAVFQAAGPRTEYYFDRRLGAEEPAGVELVVIGRAGLDRDALGEVLAG